VSALRLGTRGSALALAQAAWVKRRIEEHDASLQVEIRVIKTSGDRVLDAPIQTIGGKGVFTKEIEEALLRREIDFAVHSLKDLPTRLPHGLMLAAVPEREDARDVLVTRGVLTLAGLSTGARVGTGSLRRRAQLLHHRSDLEVLAVRGNIDTRLKKLDAGEFDALVMAAAGLRRIGRAERINEFLSDTVCVSAAGQGALAIETRADGAVRDRLAFLNDAASAAEVAAERALLDKLGGDCRVPIGARARCVGENLSMVGVVASPDGGRTCRDGISGAMAEAAELGRQLAEKLLAKGAGQWLAAFK
jgi:hydroxymethylbilane synthase